MEKMRCKLEQELGKSCTAILIISLLIRIVVVNRAKAKQQLAFPGNGPAETGAFFLMKVAMSCA